MTPRRDDDSAAVPAERVSVVIPTTGRPSLLRSIDSVLAQTVPVHRIIVVVDGPADLLPALPDDPRITVVEMGERQGPNAARAAAIQVVDDGLVGLLDDDDVWSPTKVEVQVAAFREAVRAGAEHVVVLCRMWFVDAKGAPLPIPPARQLRRRESIGSYLFDRPSIRGTTGSLGSVGSSILLFDRELADLVPFDTSLTRHEDWDWLLRVDAARAAEIVMVPDLVVGYTVQDFGASASSSGDWRTSEAWVHHASDVLTDRQQAEVLLSVTVPLAMRRGEWGAVARIMVEALGLRPSYRSVAFSLAHIPLLASRRVRATLTRR